eukprot:753684-Hanusia_phi.AAC.2
MSPLCPPALRCASSVSDLNLQPSNSLLPPPATSNHSGSLVLSASSRPRPRASMLTCRSSSRACDKSRDELRPGSGGCGFTCNRRQRVWSGITEMRRPWQLPAHVAVPSSPLSAAPREQAPPSSSL